MQTVSALVGIVHSSDSDERMRVMTAKHDIAKQSQHYELL